MENGLLEEKSEITIEELAEDIEMLIWQYGIEHFKITEHFPNRGKYSSLVRGLHVGIENDFVCGTDYDKILEENLYMMRAFLKDSVLRINRTITNEYRKGELCFKDGHVCIEVLMD